MGLVIPSTDPRQIEKALDDSLLRFIDNTVIVNPRFFKKIYEGYGFAVSHRFEGVADGSSVDLYFENPSDSGRTVYLITVEVGSFGQAYIDVYRSNTVTASGTTLTPVNLNFASSNSSVVKVEYGGTYTTGTLTLNTICPGGKRSRAVGALADIGECAVMPEGFNFLVKVTNKSGTATDISIRIVWWEE